MQPGDRYSIGKHEFLVLDQKDYWTYWTMAELPRPNAIYLIQLTYPRKFITDLPDPWKPPTQQHPHTGLPPNVWCGVKVKRAQDLGLAEELLDVRARLRWIEDETEGKSRTLLFHFLESWRCSNCGHRGQYLRPKKCPHHRVLCGDAALDPEVRWLMRYGVVPRGYREEAAALGVDVWPEVPKVQGVTT